MKSKRLLITLSVIVLAVGLMLSQLILHTRDTGLSDWYDGADGYQQAIMESKASNKPVALFFHADWCSSCKSLRETILSTKQVRQYMSDLIRVKIEPEKSYAARKIADSYGVAGFPTFIIVTPGSAISRQVRKLANITPEDFIGQCEQILLARN